MRSRGARVARVAMVAVVAVCVPLVASLARAQTAPSQPAPPSAERLKSAAEEYDRGRRAYLANDFEQAAIHFENAYNDAPRAEALRNAIRARTQAKEFARAATLSALAEALYASDTPTMELATATLKDARSKLYQVTIACTPECGIAADGRVASHDDTKSFIFFLDPGAHDVTVSWPGDRSKITHVDAKAGGHSEITVEAPPIPPPPPTQAPPPPLATQAPTSTGPVEPPPPPPSKKPFGKIPFFVGAGLTAAGIGVTIWSGLDAQNNPGVDAVKKDCVGQGESCPTYQKGLQAQTRTNVILASTGGVALVTAVIGVFFTQWSSEKLGSISPRFDVSQRGGSVGLGGQF